MIVLLSFVSYAQSALEPFKGSISNNPENLVVASRVNKIFQFDMRENRNLGWPIFRYLVSPTWTPEKALTIYLPDTGNAIIVVALPREIIARNNYHLVPIPGKSNTYYSEATPEPYVPKVDRYRIYISRILAEKTVLLYSYYIRNAQYPSDGRIVLDGTGYSFCVYIRGLGFISAGTTSPDSGSICYELVECANRLIHYGLSESSSRENALRNFEIFIDRIIEWVPANQQLKLTE